MPGEAGSNGAEKGVRKAVQNDKDRDIAVALNDKEQDCALHCIRHRSVGKDPDCLTKGILY